MKITSKLLGGAGAALLVASIAAPAQAQTVPLYSGGGTLAEKVYRDVFNCYGNHSGADTVAGLNAPPAVCNGATPYRSNVEPLYVGVGSGNGLTAFTKHDATQFTLPTGGSARTPDAVPVPSTTDFHDSVTGSYYGTGVGGGWTAGTTPAFPKVSFVGSDDPLTPTLLGTYNTNSAANGWGAAIQVPALVTTIAVPFKPATGTWTEKGKDLTTSGGTSKLQLSTNTWCGIFTGAITDWNDAAITADNAGTSLTGGASKTITVVYRSDSSGSTFLFTNALINQCATTAHPVPATWLTGSNAVGANNKFFLNVASAGAFPVGSTFIPTATGGSSGMRNTINANAGSIGYLSPDFIHNIDSTGPVAANLQTYYSFVNSGTVAKKFVAASPKAGTAIMSAVKAPLSTAASCPVGTAAGQSPDGICSHNALNWGVTNPTPMSASAFPIGGFTFIDMYTCYASSSDVNALVSKAVTTPGSFGLFRWYFGSATDNASLVKNSLTANGFSLVPSAWSGAAKKLLTTDAKAAVGTPGQVKTGCATVSGSGA